MLSKCYCLTCSSDSWTSSKLVIIKYLNRFIFFWKSILYAMYFLKHHIERHTLYLFVSLLSDMLRYSKFILDIFCLQLGLAIYLKALVPFNGECYLANPNSCNKCLFCCHLIVVECFQRQRQHYHHAYFCVMKFWILQSRNEVYFFSHYVCEGRV